MKITHHRRFVVLNLCLLISVGIFFMWKPLTVSANSHAQITRPSDDSTGHPTGSSDTSTNINEAGSSDDQEDLSELNIANTVTVTYNTNNGLTAIAVAPLIILMMTSFTRILIVLHFTRAALGTQTAPPNQIMIGLALILTYFIMQPTIHTIYTEAILPFENYEMDQEEALEKAVQPLREFMYPETMTRDVQLFMDISGTEWDGRLDSIPTSVLIPAFMISELRTSFTIGFMLYIPFLVIDMVVASTLMAMGMMMLPPTAISMPFKILLFVLADGWNLVIGNLVKTFY